MRKLANDPAEVSPHAASTRRRSASVMFGMASFMLRAARPCQGVSGPIIANNPPIAELATGSGSRRAAPKIRTTSPASSGQMKILRMVRTSARVISVARSGPNGLPIDDISMAGGGKP
jgi:hypothetical protein